MSAAAARGTRSTPALKVPQEEEEEDLEEEEDGNRRKEGAVGRVTNKKRPPNFDSVEDEIIARCWKNLTNDAKTGTDQTSDTFWQRLFVKFTTVMMEEQKRTQAVVNEHRSWQTLRSRWRRCIQKECMLFASIYRRVCTTVKSGWNDDDYVKEALARYRVVHGKNRDFSFLPCWKTLKDEPKFQLMMRQSTPDDEEVPAVISTQNDNLVGDPEGDASAVTSISDAQHSKKKVRKSASSYSAINGPPIGTSGRPMGVKKTKASLKDALALETELKDIASQRHEDVAGLLVRIGDRMNHLAHRIDVQSSFLGSLVFLQMGETEKAHAMADAGRSDLLVEKKDGEQLQKEDAAEESFAEDAINDDDDGSKEDGNESNTSDEEKENIENRSTIVGTKLRKVVVVQSKLVGAKRSSEASTGGDENKKRKKKATEKTIGKFGYCCAGRRCGRFAETGGALDRMNFSPNAEEDLEDILDKPKHRCTGCCLAFCGGTCGIGESADDYICNACLSLP